MCVISGRFVHFSKCNCSKLWMGFGLSCLNCCGCFYVRTMQCQFKFTYHLAVVFSSFDCFVLFFHGLHVYVCVCVRVFVKCELWLWREAEMECANQRNQVSRQMMMLVLFFRSEQHSTVAAVAAHFDILWHTLALFDISWPQRTVDCIYCYSFIVSRIWHGDGEWGSIILFFLSRFLLFFVFQCWSLNRKIPCSFLCFLFLFEIVIGLS